MRAERIETVASLETTVIGDPSDRLAIVFLHGFSMSASVFSPFAHSLGVSAQFWLPDGPVAAHGGRAWWPIDLELRAATMALGPRDLFEEDPPGRMAARSIFARWLDEIAATVGDRPLVLIGFSQGGMLALDHVLHQDTRFAAMALLSSSRIAWSEWQPRLHRLRGLPMLVSHGRSDDDLGFHCGEALRDAAIAGGADTTWVPFDGGHGVPLVVWRALRRFLTKLG